MKLKTSLLAMTAAGLIAGFGGCHRLKAADIYSPVIDPANFSSVIDNTYFKMPAGKVMAYEGQTPDGFENSEISISGETREIMGVKTLIIDDHVTMDGVIHEHTRDFVAQDKDGNVWYFGEEVDNYAKGKLKDHHGSWMAGVKGALPGIWMKSKNTVGDSYRQDYLKGEAEDMAKIVDLDATVTVKAGSFQHCLKVFESTPLEPDAKEHKYYCPETAGTTLVEDMKESSRLDLIQVSGGG